MSRTKVGFFVCVLLLCSAVSLMAQQAASVDSVVPSMVKFTGTLSDTNGKPLTGIQGVTFLLYKEETGGAPLWMETENVQADKNGHYSVMLGSATAHGLPADVFVDGEARWLAVQVSGQTEQPRTMLMSVPYALKAADAETLGGKPLSAFQLAPEPNSSGAATKNAQTNPPAIEQANEIVCSSTTACKTGFIPLFSSNGGSAKVGDSIVSQRGTTLKIAGSQTVNGGIASGGIITATSAASAPAILGTSTGTAGTSNGVQGVASSATASGVAGVNSSGIGVYGFSNGATGVYGQTSSGSYGMAGVNTSGAVGIGVYGLSSGTSGDSAGVWGTSQTGYAPGVEGVNTSTASGAVGVSGSGAGYGVVGNGNVGVLGANTTSHGVYGETTSPTAFGVVGLNSAAGGIGVHGAAPNGNSFFADSNAQQARTAGGWIKAMAYYTLGANTITQCFNSTLSGTAARTPPCGFVSDSPVTGSAWIDFGFQVDDRFYSVVGSTLACNGISCSMPVILACGDKDCSLAGTPNRLGIIATDISNNPCGYQCLCGRLLTALRPILTSRWLRRRGGDASNRSCSLPGCLRGSNGSRPSEGIGPVLCPP